MLTRLIFLGGFAGLALGSVACTGVDPVAVVSFPDGGGDPDTGAERDTGVPADGGTIDPDAAHSVDCQKNEDCRPYTQLVTPKDCATAVCLPTGQCRLVAVDQDNDGDRTDVCSSPDLDVLLGTDCDDADPHLNGGTSELCVPDSAPPGTTLKTLATGSCKAGTRRCGVKPGKPACNATNAVFPATTDRCDVAGNDDTCDGLINGGCSCVANATRPCTNQAGTCAGAQQTCAVSGNGNAWGACSKVPMALDCGGKTDNDCDGTLDSMQSACMCDGTTPIGGSGACSTGLYGVCAPGTRTCAASGSTAAWGACMQDTQKSTELCDAVKDYDCNAIAADNSTTCVGPAPSGACGSPVRAGATLSNAQTTTFTQCKDGIGAVTWSASGCSVSQTVGSKIRVVCAARAPSGWYSLQLAPGTNYVGPFVSRTDSVCGGSCGGNCVKLLDSANNPCWIAP